VIVQFNAVPGSLPPTYSPVCIGFKANPVECSLGFPEKMYVRCLSSVIQSVGPNIQYDLCSDGWSSQETTTTDNDEFNRIIYYNFSYVESITPPFEFCGEPGGRNYGRSSEEAAHRINGAISPMFGGDDFQFYPGVTWTVEDLGKTWGAGNTTATGGGTSGSHSGTWQDIRQSTTPNPRLQVYILNDTYFDPGLVTEARTINYYYHSDQISSEITRPPDLVLKATKNDREEEKNYTFNRVVFQKVSSPYSTKNFDNVWCLDSIEAPDFRNFWLEYRLLG
jgi:hypothetical protein